MSDLSQHTPQFSPRRQSLFLEALSDSGNVRLACAAADISPQTVYRARRSDAGLAQLWDAALLHARCAVEQVLADRALNGVEEPVFFRGEEIGSRRKYDSRLLLAHLARLDRLAESALTTAVAEDFDEALAALAQGEAFVPRDPAAPYAVAEEEEYDPDADGPIVSRFFDWMETQGVDDPDIDYSDYPVGDPAGLDEEDLAKHAFRARMDAGWLEFLEREAVRVAEGEAAFAAARQARKRQADPDEDDAGVSDGAAGTGGGAADGITPSDPLRGPPPRERGGL